MLAKTWTGAVVGVDGLLVRVEAHVGRGVSSFRTVGLPDACVRESHVRIRSALETCGLPKLEGTVTVNLAPATVRKQGSGYDLAVALALLVALGAAPAERLADTAVLGELALDGGVRAVRGVLPVVSRAASSGLGRVIVPRANASEAALVNGITTLGVGSLHEALDWVTSGTYPSEASSRRKRPRKPAPDALDLSDVRGQHLAKRALEIAAAGGHNVLMTGPPGAGKSLLATRLPSLLPSLGERQALEVTRIYSVSGMLEEGALVRRPPFRAPHHTISAAAMVGGGAGPRPGEVSMAHRGVLFLDELAEFPRPALESLRQPLEEGCVRIRRVDQIATLPARFMLIAAMNPCPCGYLGADVRPCSCTPAMVHRYQAKISGPLLDRIDLHVPVRAISSGDLLSSSSGERSESVRHRVSNARRIQEKRFRRCQQRLNAFMSPKQLERHCALSAESEELVTAALDRLGLTARAFHRVLKVARTLADLGESRSIEPRHLQEAIAFRASSLPR